MKYTLLLFAVLKLATTPVWTASKVVTLSLPTMNCAACPITVKKALGKVPGVSHTEVDLDKRMATVTFDDSKTNTSSITEATRNAGYPATLTGKSN